MENQESVAELLPSRCLWCQGFQPYPKSTHIQYYFFGLGFGVTFWAQALQLCLTFECRRKGPYGSANLAAIKDTNYAIINRLRRARDWVTGTAPQPVLKDGDIYSTGQSQTRPA